jgi:hypothetical protein
VTDIPPILALLLGCLVGFLVYSPVRRWLVTLRKVMRQQRDAPDARRRDSGTLLAIFTTMHPAPWLLLMAVPFALYCFWSGQLRPMWLAFLGGILVALALMRLVEARRGPGPRP